MRYDLFFFGVYDSIFLQIMPIILYYYIFLT